MEMVVRVVHGKYVSVGGNALVCCKCCIQRYAILAKYPLCWGCHRIEDDAAVQLMDADHEVGEDSVCLRSHPCLHLVSLVLVCTIRAPLIEPTTYDRDG